MKANNIGILWATALVALFACSSRSTQQVRTARADASGRTPAIQAARSTETPAADAQWQQCKGTGTSGHEPECDDPFHETEVPAPPEGASVQVPVQVPVEKCPTAIDGTIVWTEDVDDGIAVVFKTASDVSALRRSVRRMAEMHNSPHSEAFFHTRQMHGGAAPAPTPAKPSVGRAPSGHARFGEPMANPENRMVPPSTARTEDMENGIRLILTPLDVEELPTLRARIALRANRMAEGSCPMMSADDPGMRQPVSGTIDDNARERSASPGERSDDR